ncbi:olfactory receptor 52Z1P-like [Diretmus argenteus]
MYTNVSITYGTLLTMESLALSPASVYPAFLIGTFTYLIILFCNLLVLTNIFINRKLHKPMYILLSNLSISDLIGATAFFPQLTLSIVLENRSISYLACYIQALLIHIYGSGNLLILTAMAYDRYVAICCPLKYNSIMTQNNLIRIIISIWLIDFTLILLLLGLVARFQLCRKYIVDMYCNNPSIVKLVCEDTTVNNYYGLCITALLQGGSLIVIVYTYIQILLTCVMNKKSDARRKAIQTCGTHLTVFLFLQINTAITLIAHRFKNTSPYMRRTLGVSVVVFPPVLNPLVYGLRTKELSMPPHNSPDSEIAMVRAEILSLESLLHDVLQRQTHLASRLADLHRGAVSSNTECPTASPASGPSWVDSTLRKSPESFSRIFSCNYSSACEYEFIDQVYDSFWK